MRAALLMLLLAGTLVSARQQAPAVDLQKIGPQPGEVVPDFELRDQHGASRRLSALAGPKGTMLVFYRSADW